MTTMNNEDPADPRVHDTPRELPEPAAWVRDLASPQPHCVTSLRYRSKSDADAGTWYAPLYTADQMREAIAAERERDYLRWRLREIMPLFEEARDALCAISLVAATVYRVDLSLGSRMDAAGTRTREEFDAMLTAEGEITHWMPRQRRLMGSTG